MPYMYVHINACICVHVCTVHQSTKNATLINTKWPSNFVFELYDARRRRGGRSGSKGWLVEARQSNELCVCDWICVRVLVW